MNEHRFTLYAFPGRRPSRIAEENLRRLMAEAGIEEFVLEVVDVKADPGRAEEAGILATPTLVREVPQPRRRIVGDLSDSAVVRAALGLQQRYPAARGAN